MNQKSQFENVFVYENGKAMTKKSSFVSFAKGLVVAGLIAVATIGIISDSHAKNNEDNNEKIAQSACMIRIDDSETIRLVNTEYIRMVVINKEDPNVVIVRTSTNIDNYTPTGIVIQYPTEKDALNAMLKLSDAINNCSSNRNTNP